MFNWLPDFAIMTVIITTHSIYRTSMSYDLDNLNLALKTSDYATLGQSLEVRHFVEVRSYLQFLLTVSEFPASDRDNGVCFYLKYRHI